MQRHTMRRMMTVGVMACLLLGTLACSISSPLGGNASGPGTFDGADKLKTTVKDKLTIGGPAGKGSITTYFDADNWTFDGKAGQSVTIFVASIKGSDPHVKLFDPTGTVIGDDDDSGGGSSAEIDIDLTATGTYTIRIDMLEATGDYTVSVK